MTRLEGVFRRCGLRLASPWQVKTGDHLMCSWEARGTPRNHEALLEALLDDPDVRGWFPPPTRLQASKAEDQEEGRRAGPNSGPARHCLLASPGIAPRRACSGTEMGLAFGRYAPAGSAVG